MKLLLLVILLAFSSSNQVLSNSENEKSGLKKVTGKPAYARFNINKIATWVQNNGFTDDSGLSAVGLIYPKGSNKSCVFQSGFIWGGKVNGEIRVGGSTYNTGLVPGAVLHDGTREKDTLSHVRIYRVRRDYKTGNLSNEAFDEGLTESQVYEMYHKDWNEWPAQYGAPYEDIDGNGIYDPIIDIPGVPGADQTIWYVANDLDPDASQILYGSLPLGIEMQATVYGYNRIGPLGSTVFRKYLLINKSTNDFEDFYVSMWSDPDVGDAIDDFVGCDTTLDLGFAYNSSNNDATYFDNPPATGYGFLQGPIVKGDENDWAYFNGRIIKGAKNLGITSFYYFLAGDQDYSDPPLGDGALQMYNFFQGKIGPVNQPYFHKDPTVADLPTKFPLYGDPVANTGWLDGNTHIAGDRRYGIVSGPFTFAAGDTQEVVLAQVATGASAGVDRLRAVDYLKQFYTVIRGMFYNEHTNIDEPSELPFQYGLSQNFPNPFNPSTQIEFSIPKITEVSLKVFNVLGEKVATLINRKEYLPGNYKIEFNAKDLNSGIYFYRLVTNDFYDVKKMILIK